MNTQDKTILSLHGISKSFFGVEVLHSIELDIKEGEIHGIVGENGAGKSTLMNILGGIYQPNKGEMILDGQPFHPRSSKDAFKKGISFVHQELVLFPNLTVAENLYIEEFPLTKTKAVDYKLMRKTSEHYLQMFGIDAKPNDLVEKFAMGVRQTIEIIKAVIGNAKIVIFDEPTTSLSIAEKEKLFGIIQELRKNNVTIIYISHILEDIFALTDRVSVLRDGSLIGTKRTQELGQQEIISMMVGRSLSNIYPTMEREIGQVCFQAEGVTSAVNKVHNVSFEIRKGEILGLFGLMGSGRTELARMLFGLDPMLTGSIVFGGVSNAKPTPQWCIKNGMAFITENRREEGLLMPKTVRENLSLVALPKMKKPLGVIDRSVEESKTQEQVDGLQIKVFDKNAQLVQNLSGGNQQKVVIGKWLANQPALFLMDEPTRGVDVGAKHEIYSIMLQLASQGTAILMISSEMEELIGMCDRIMVMNDGKIVGALEKGEINAEKIIQMAIM